jgi:hypothetical protein
MAACGVGGSLHWRMVADLSLMHFDHRRPSSWIANVAASG